MIVFPLSARLEKYLKKHSLVKQFAKQKGLFEKDPFHPSLQTEILEPKHLKFYSFRITRKYRAVFVYIGNDQVEIIDINNHYK